MLDPAAPLEVEVRYRCADPQPLVTQLLAWGASPLEERTEVDHYFNAPHKDFRQTDEALRLRRVGASNWLTYKGPRREGPTKTRPEIEVVLAQGDVAAEAAQRLLQALGFRPVAVVRKRRSIYRLPWPPFAVNVCFDRLEAIGSFVELEIMAPPELHAAASQAVLELAAALHLTEREYRSYLRMVLEAQASCPAEHPSRPDGDSGGASGVIPRNTEEQSS